MAVHLMKAIHTTQGHKGLSWLASLSVGQHPHIEYRHYYNWHLPTDHAILQIVDLDELPKAAGVVVMGCLCIAKCLLKEAGTMTSATFIRLRF